MSKVVILGLGKTGLSCVNYFLRQGITPMVLDTRANPPGRQELASGVELRCGALDAELLCQAELIIASPGIALATPALQAAAAAGVEIIGGQDGADPASVVYDAVAAAKARNADVLICDTAGRLHNKKNLMEELRKIYRILEREYPEAYLETLVVLDGTTGQNALSQARQFAEVANVTGIILTKLDGTAKGGIAVAIQSELDIPVKYIGVGESIDDLQKFDADAFVNALFDVEERS